MNRKVMLQYHLANNHFPPVDSSFVPTAEAAIDAVTEWRHDIFDGSDLSILDTPLTLPNGVELTVGKVMDQLHLWDFVDHSEDE